MKYRVQLPTSLGLKLEVLQEIPDKGDKFPTVLLVPGFGVDLHEFGLFDDITDALVKNGFNTIRFSFAGTGKSEGDFVEMTIDQQVIQLTEVLAYTQKDRFTQANQIGVLGHGMGVSVIGSALPLLEAKTFVFISSVGNPADSLARRMRRQRTFNPEGISKLERSDKTVNKVGPQFWKSVQSRNLVAQMRKLTQPTLFIHGSKDKLAKGPGAQLLYDAVTAKKQFSILEKAPHSFPGPYRPVLLDIVTDWFEQTLR